MKNILIVIGLAVLPLIVVNGMMAQPAPSPAASPATTWVSVIAAHDAALDHYFVGPIYQQSLGALQHIAGNVRAATLSEIQHRSDVMQVLTNEAHPLPPQPDPEHTSAPTLDLKQRGADRIRAAIDRLKSQPIQPSSPRSWYENDTQGVRDTWTTYHLSGTGVMLAVIDSGVDFGNPALKGRYAVQTATLAGSQAYVGWPIAFDDRSMSQYLANPSGGDNWGWYVNASRVITGSGLFTFTDAPTHSIVYTAPGVSRSGRYYLGYHPDGLLGNAVVLVADSIVSGRYDTVFMDLNDDGAFDTMLSRTQPIGTLDLNGDGVPDVSAGMLYWISDGLNPPPGSLGVYGPNVPIPPSGRLIAFMIDDLLDSGGGHGTMCASTAIGNDGGVFTPEPRVASFYTTTYGPLVQGPAPDAKLIAIGNVYAGGAIDADYLFTIMGYDGMPNSGDEPLMASLSYGDSTIDNDGWDWESRFLTYLNLNYARSPLFIHSSGNGGFGRGTLIAPNPLTGLNAGASTQYGTLNAWGLSETVSLPARVNVGDIASFSDRGPAADGVRGVDLVANGMSGTGAYPVNNSNDGTLAYVHWTGTSRSAPVIAGMGALAAQGFKQAQDRWPTYAELRRILINSGRNLNDDVMTQGAGQAYAFRAAQVASGQYGLTIDPPVIDNFVTAPAQIAHGVLRGHTYTQAITLTNVSPAPITATLGAQQLIEVAHYTATMATLTDTASNYARGVPDYALNLTPWIMAQPNADLMVVRLTAPFEHFDTLPPTPPGYRNVWRLIVYNWWDDNANSQWWTDNVIPNGRVDWPGEIDSRDQWMRFDYGRSNATQQEVRVHQPYSRSIGAGAGGIWAGAAQAVRSAGDNRTTLMFDVIFYRESDWPDVSVPANHVSIPAHSQASVQAIVHVPLTSTYGLHQGSIVVADAGRTDLQATDRPFTSLVPLAWQVAADPIGGSSSNDAVGGGFSWLGNGEESDGRFYSFDLNQPPEGSAIVVHSTWQDYPTDIDTIVFGPTIDVFADQWPQWFGPAALTRVGGTARSGTRPAWNFATTTGTTEDWSAAPAQPGEHIVAQQAVLLGGHQSSVPLTTTIGLVYARPYLLRADPTCMSCAITTTFTSSIDLPNGITGTHAFGWFTPTVQTTPLITQGSSITHSLVLTGAAYRLDVSLRNVSGAHDLDLQLYDDSGSLAGQWDSSDVLLAAAIGPGVDKHLVLHGLAAGQYWISVHGQAVDPSGGSYSLEVTPMPYAIDNGLKFTGLPTNVVAGQVYVIAAQAMRPAMNGQRGLITFGPKYVADAIELPIDVEPLSDVWVAVSGQAEALAGGTIAYTLTFGNHGPSAAHDVAITDTLPISVIPSTITYGVAALSAGEVQTRTITGTLAASVDNNTLLTNTAAISAQEFDPSLGNNAAAVGSLAVAPFDLWVSQTAPSHAAAGGPITYTLVYGNNGPSGTRDVWLTDTLPISVTAIGPVTRGVASLAAGAVQTWTLVAVSASSLPTDTVLTNTVTITTRGVDLSAGNNSAQAATILYTAADVWVQKFGPPFASANDVITYTILLGNNGPSDAHGISAYEVPPISVTINAPLTYTVGSLTPGTTAVWVITGTIGPDLTRGQPITNQVVIAAQEFDPVSQNNLGQTTLRGAYFTYLPITLRNF
jgi:uncharacterized repeat protein (TIGR01451 family)